LGRNRDWASSDLDHARKRNVAALARPGMRPALGLWQQSPRSRIGRRSASVWPIKRSILTAAIRNALDVSIERDRRRGELPHEIGSTTEPGLRVAENYWFNCPACGYDWPSLLMPSIIFVSLSFVTDQCPNCQKKHVPAYRVGPGR
jgi:hypothetical protein